MSTARDLLARRTRRLVAEAGRLAAEATHLSESVERGVAYEGLVRSMSRRALGLITELSRLDGMREALSVLEGMEGR